MKKSTICLVATALLAGCASQTRSVEKSGFLKNYSMLKEGKSGESLLYYAKPDIDLSKYDQVLIEPITIWAAHEDALSDVPKDELDRLGKLFYNAVKEEISKVKRVVTSPSPRTMRLRLAITEATDTVVAANLLTTIHPISLVVGEALTMAIGTRMFVGKASIEGQATDSMTGELLVVGVDRRQGGKGFAIGDWTHVEDAMKYWAQRMREKITELSKSGS